jgi:hypothetical protein
MTDLEFQYIERAIETLKSDEVSDMARAKILQTVSEISGTAAQRIRNDLSDRVDEILLRN